MSGTSAAPRTEPATVASNRPAVVAFLADEESEAALRGGLGPLVEEMQVRRGTAATAARAMEREATPRVLIVDVAGMEDPSATLDSLAAVCEPDVRVLVVGDREDLAFYRRLTQGLGVQEYLYKPLTRDNVARLFGAAIAGAVTTREANGRGGRLISVISARGGAGATTIATNIALSVAGSSRGHVGLLDLHLRGGTVALGLGVRPGAGLKVALEHPERADSLFLERAAIPVAERVRVIAADEPIETDTVATPDSLEHFLTLLRDRFNTILVDLPMPPGPVERAVLGASRQVLIVFGPDVGGLRDALALKRFVISQGTGAHPIMVLNRDGMPGALTQKLVEEGLQGKPDYVIPFMPKPLLRAFNLGLPAVKESQAFARALGPLVREVSGVAQKRTGGLFGLFGGGDRRA
jgi:pilus assembly protein CpaE